MNSKTLRRAAGMAAILAGGILSGGAYTVLAQVVLPTGATITPNAAPGSVFEPLKVDLPDYTNYSPDSAETTAISPDGKTLLILTSGYNLNLDANGNFQPQDSSEYVFVYDISSPSLPVKRQVVLVPNGSRRPILRWRFGLLLDFDSTLLPPAESVKSHTLACAPWRSPLTSHRLCGRQPTRGSRVRRTIVRTVSFTFEVYRAGVEKHANQSPTPRLDGERCSQRGTPPLAPSLLFVSG